MLHLFITNVGGFLLFPCSGTLSITTLKLLFFKDLPEFSYEISGCGVLKGREVVIFSVSSMDIDLFEFSLLKVIFVNYVFP